MAKGFNNKNICLNYHAFSASSKFDQVLSKYTVDFNTFIEHLNILKSTQHLALQQLTDNNIADFSYSLTFDDGYKSHLYIAEELAKRDLKGTFYIITDKIHTDKNFLNANDIREIDSLGMEIGSHACSHRHVNRLPRNEMIKELHESKSILEDILSKPIFSISYPGGHFSSREVKQAINEGYTTQRTCITGLNRLPIHNQIIKCYNIKNFVDVDYLNQLIELNSPLRMLIKIREIGLIIPKFLESKWKIRIPHL